MAARRRREGVVGEAARLGRACVRRATVSVAIETRVSEHVRKQCTFLYQTPPARACSKRNDRVLTGLRRGDRAGEVPESTGQIERTQARPATSERSLLLQPQCRPAEAADHQYNRLPLHPSSSFNDDSTTTWEALSVPDNGQRELVDSRGCKGIECFEWRAVRRDGDSGRPPHTREPHDARRVVALLCDALTSSSRKAPRRRSSSTRTSPSAASRRCCACARQARRSIRVPATELESLVVAADQLGFTGVLPLAAGGPAADAHSEQLHRSAHPVRAARPADLGARLRRGDRKGI